MQHFCVFIDSFYQTFPILKLTPLFNCKHTMASSFIPMKLTVAAQWSFEFKDIDTFIKTVAKLCSILYEISWLL